MNTDMYLSPERIAAQASYSSSKRVLEAFSELFSDDSHSAAALFEALLKREKIGSTALGKGIAIPHARLIELAEPHIAIITLKDPIDYDAPDDKPVDVFVALVVPDEDNEQHLALLQDIAAILRNKTHIAALRAAQNTQTLYSTIVSALYANLKAS